MITVSITPLIRMTHVEWGSRYKAAATVTIIEERVLMGTTEQGRNGKRTVSSEMTLFFSDPSQLEAFKAQAAKLEWPKTR